MDAYGQPIGDSSASSGGYGGHHQGQGSGYDDRSGHAYGGGGKWLDPLVKDHSKHVANAGYY